MGTVLGSPGIRTGDEPNFDDHCAACCMQASTTSPTDPATTTATTTTTTTTTMSSTTTTTTVLEESKAGTSTTTVPEQSCDELFNENCKCDNGAAQHIVSLTVLAVFAFIAFLL